MILKLRSIRLSYFIITILLIITPVFLISRVRKEINSFVQDKHRINLNAPPGSFYLTTDAENHNADYPFNLTWTNSDGADNYSVFYYSHFINEFNSSLINMINQTAVSPCEVQMPSFTMGRYHFVIVAYNRSGYTLSNCISIYFIDDKLYFFFHPLLLLIIVIGIVIALLIIWIRGRSS